MCNRISIMVSVLYTRYDFLICTACALYDPRRIPGSLQGCILFWDNIWWGNNSSSSWLYRFHQMRYKQKQKQKISVMPRCPRTEGDYLSMLFFFTQINVQLLLVWFVQFLCLMQPNIPNCAGHLGGDMASSPLHF